MTLFTVLITLLVDRVLWNPDPYRGHGWFRQYADWLAVSPARAWVNASSAGPIVMLLPPVLLVSGLQFVTHGAWGGLLEFAFSLLVLLFSLGPTDLGRDSDEYLTAREIPDEENSNRMAGLMCKSETPGDDPPRSLSVAICILTEANRRLFGPLFWFILLGPVAAALYRLTALAADWYAEKNITDSSGNMIRRLDFFLDWFPARLTALGYAAAGNFEAVAEVWKNFHAFNNDKQRKEATLLLEAAGTAALDTYPSQDELDQLSVTPPVVEDAMALVWRTLSLWIIVLAIGSLMVWIN